MSPSPIARIVALVGVALLVLYLLALVFWPPSDADLGQAWIVQPLTSIVTLTWACYVVWVLVVVVISVRLRESRPLLRVLWFAAAAWVASLVGAVIVSGVVLVQSGEEDLFGTDASTVLFVAMVSAIPFVMAAIVSIVLVELVFLRSPTVLPADANATESTPIE